MKFKTIKILDTQEPSYDYSPHGFVAIGDVHLYNSYPYGSRTELISERLQDIKRYLWNAATAASLCEYPLIINGDLIHTGIIDHSVGDILYQFFKKFKEVTIFVNLGNHDLDGEVSVLKPFVRHGHNENHIVFSKPDGITLSHGKTHFSFIPSCNKVVALQAIKEQARKTNRDFRNVLFIHATFSGSFFSNAYVSRSGLSQGNPYFKYFDLIVASDVHKYQSICKGRGFYTSSLIPLSFGEKTIDHGFHIVDLDNAKHYFIVTASAPQFLELEVSYVREMGDVIVQTVAEKNIICVANDQPNTLFDKKQLRKKLLDLGASFVSFKNAPRRKEEDSQIRINQKENVKSIVLSYSKFLAKKFELSKSKVQSVGLRILTKAEMEMGVAHQRR